LEEIALVAPYVRIEEVSQAKLKTSRR